MQHLLDSPKTIVATVALKGSGLIAEVKRRSPSRGQVMPGGLDPGSLARLYGEAGAEAVSVVVEEEHFGGSPALFAAVAGAVSLPLLWKDFVTDPYQVELASAMGASADSPSVYGKTKAAGEEAV